MVTGNHPTATLFIFVGLTQQPELQLPLFLLFLGISVVARMGNLALALLIAVSSPLHTPMYYFLSSLSFINLCYSLVITPKMLVNFLGRKKNMILYLECMTQLFFFMVFMVAKSHLLTVMTYDHYAATCNLLLYSVVMSSRVYCLVAFILGFLCLVPYASHMMKLSFYRSYLISHYFCDILPLLNLPYSSTYLSELLLFVIVGFNTLVPTLAIFISYAFILYSILHIQASEGQSKAFRTCSSDLVAVGDFSGSVTFMYFKLPSSNSLNQKKASSVFDTTMIPILSPLIYSLRSKDVKEALRKLLVKKCFAAGNL